MSTAPRTTTPLSCGNAAAATKCGPFVTGRISNGQVGNP
jgi:hypothetical protein